MKTRMLRSVVFTFAAASIALAGGIVVSAPASAQTASSRVVASAPTSVPNAAVAKKTRKCVLAKKREKAAKRAEAAAQGGTFANYIAAHDRYLAATAARKKACRVVKPAKPTDPRVPGVVVPGDASTTYTHDVNDPRPWNWTRPADGSGRGGSNYLGRGSVMTMTNCPATFTVSAYKVLVWPGLDDGMKAITPEVSYENFSPREISVHVEMDVVDGRGQYYSPWRDGNLLPPSRTLMSETRLLPAWSVNGISGIVDDADINRTAGTKILAVRVICA